MAKFVGVVRPSGRNRFAFAGAALISGATLSLVNLIGPAESAPRRIYYTGGGWFTAPAFVNPIYSRKRKLRSTRTSKKQRQEARTEPSFGEMPKGPLQIVVSLGTQRVTLFSNGVRVAQGPVSTGTASHPTPLGLFSIIQKNRHHRSNLYSNAPMPYMQRITWSGVALHEGLLPGYPASHGCIRLSRDFASKLWRVTKLGARVIVARSDLAPVDFDHPKLFAPKQKPAEPQIASRPEVGSSSPPLKLAQVPASEAHQGAVDDVKPIGHSVGPGADRAGERPLRPGDLPNSMEVSQSNQSQKPAEGTPTPPARSAADNAASSTDPVKPGPTVDPSKPLVPLMRAADASAKRNGQLSVFISRKERRIFVRQGFIPVFDMPIAIEEPDRPLGTHLFTALAFTDDGADMRWNLFSIPSSGLPSVEPSRRRASKTPAQQASPSFQHKLPSTAAEALDRVVMPPEVVDRIDELLVPGSSLLISDEGLGKETGRYTEFIVLTR